MSIKKCIKTAITLVLVFSIDLPVSYGAEGDKSGQPVSFIQELNHLQAGLADAHITAQKKHSMLIQLAQLLELSGNIEAAAMAWQEAAFVEDGIRDDSALLECIGNFIAIGEWDKADSYIKLILLTIHNNNAILLRARYLAAQIEALRNGNEIYLSTLADDPDFIVARPALYWALWKLSGKSEYRTKLTTEYPQSPETKTIFSPDSKYGVLEASSPQWMLSSSEITLGPAVITPTPVPTEPSKQPPLQTGVFNRRENAASQADRLKRAGFNAEISRRLSGGSEYWSVTVPSGTNMQQSIIMLKEAGFDAFPVY